MILNILVVAKTILYMMITNIQVNRILVLLLTSLVTITIMEALKEKKNGFRVFFYSIFSALLFADSMYYVQFGTLPSVELLKQIALLSAVGDSIKDLISIKNLLLLIDLPFVIGLSIYFRDKDIDLKRGESYPKYSLIALGLVFLVSLLSGKMESLKNQEVYLYHITDIVESFSGKEARALEKELAEGNNLEEQILDLRDRASFKEGKHTGIGRDRDLLVLQVEALQEFVIGLEYEGVEITPNLNKLIEDKSTIHFDKYYQLVGRGNTSDAEFVTNNSIYPAMDEPSYSKYGDKEFYGLPMVLKDQGYKTMAMHGFRGDYWNRETAYKGQGFDKFYDMETYEDYEHIGFGVSDRDFFLQNVETLKKFKDETGENFYSFMISLTSHTPFNMPEQHIKFGLKKEHEDTMLGRYLQSIHYTDEQIGLLIEELKDKGLYEDMVIAIYGDHFAVSSVKDEEREVMTDFFGYPYELDEMMNIPLIIHVPGEEINETISRTGSQLDFFPTILNIMGYENEKGLVFGRDLLNFQGENFVAPQTYMIKGSVILDDAVFVMSRDGVFEHSRAYNKETKEALSIEEFEGDYLRAIKEINLAEYIMNKGIYEDYIKTGNLEIVEDNQEDRQVIRLKDKPSLEDIEKIGEKHKYIELNLKNEDEDYYIVDTDIHIEDLLELQKGKEFKYIFKMENDEEWLLYGLYDNYELGENLAEFKNFESYVNLTNSRYKEIVLNPENFKKEEVEDLLNRFPDLGIIVEKKSELRKLSGKVFTYK